ncbi:cysteine dioxygenase [Ramlibacter sp.]|uniref:cysteine dioxygenase family protein n=1 Tax=Ramlibacter sp. TaxID=1917967 RepID=UPI003D111929
MLSGNPTFDSFLRDMEALLDEAGDDEPRLLAQGQQRLAQLVAEDAWLPAKYLEAEPEKFTQYLLHRDTRKGFTVLCVSWGPGGWSSPHDHKTWGLIGQLRGAESTRVYRDAVAGQPLVLQSECVLRPGETTAVSPTLGDIHEVRNVFDGDSVSIHVYGADLASLAPLRRRYDEATGATTPFVASYR